MASETTKVETATETVDIKSTETLSYTSYTTSILTTDATVIDTIDSTVDVTQTVTADVTTDVTIMTSTTVAAAAMVTVASIPQCDVQLLVNPNFADGILGWTVEFGPQHTWSFISCNDNNQNPATRFDASGYNEVLISQTVENTLSEAPTN